jgi:helicase required for RNAi-mediated heterochromatin assembly 1
MRLIVSKSLIPILYTICLEDFGFKFKEVNIKFKQLKKLEAKTFAKNNNNIKALKGAITLLKDNYTGKIVNIIKNGKVH